MIFFKSANVLSSYFLRCDIISFLDLWNLNFPQSLKNVAKKQRKTNEDRDAMLAVKNKTQNRWRSRPYWNERKEPLFDDHQVEKTKKT